jgi:hypothetical protein
MTLAATMQNLRRESDEAVIARLHEIGIWFNYSLVFRPRSLLAFFFSCRRSARLNEILLISVSSKRIGYNIKATNMSSLFRREVIIPIE